MAKPVNRQPLKPDFKATTPSAFERAGGDPLMTAALAAIEARADKLKTRARTHAKAFEDRWTAREAISLWKRYLSTQGKHPAPTNAVRDIAPEAVMKTAARQVEARTLQRLAKINAIKTRMGNALIRSMETRGLTLRFNDAAPDGAAAARRRLLRVTP